MQQEQQILTAKLARNENDTSQAHPMQPAIPPRRTNCERGARQPWRELTGAAHRAGPASRLTRWKGPELADPELRASEQPRRAAHH